MRLLSSSFYTHKCGNWVCAQQPSAHFGLEQSHGRSCPLAWVNRNASTKGRLDEGRKATVFFFFGPRRFALVYLVCVFEGSVGLTLTEFFLQVESPFRVNHLPWHFPFLVYQRTKHSTYTTYLLPSVGVDWASSWNRCSRISWCKIGQTSSTSKGEISWQPPSSLTSEANTFSAKLRVASSIAKRGFRVLVFKHFLRSHPRVSATHKAQCQGLPWVHGSPTLCPVCQKHGGASCLFSL